MIVRPIEPRDVRAIMDMGYAMHCESEYSDLAYEPQKVIDRCNEIIADHGFNQVGLIAEEADGEVVGMIGGYIFLYEYGKDLCAADHLVYIKPEKRGGRGFLKLIRAFIAWANSRGVVQIFMRTTTGIKTAETARLYERLGFHNVGNIVKMTIGGNT